MYPTVVSAVTLLLIKVKKVRRKILAFFILLNSCSKIHENLDLNTNLRLVKVSENDKIISVFSNFN